MVLFCIYLVGRKLLDQEFNDLVCVFVHILFALFPDEVGHVVAHLPKRVPDFGL